MKQEDSVSAWLVVRVKCVFQQCYIIGVVNVVCLFVYEEMLMFG